MSAAANGHAGAAAYLIDKGAAFEAKDEVRAALTRTLSTSLTPCTLSTSLTPCTWTRTGVRR